MQGRLENEIKIQKATDKMIKDLPDYVNEWYMNMRASRKTASSMQDYIRKVRKFLLYIDDKPKKVKTEQITLQTCESYMISCQTKMNNNGLLVYTSDSYQQGIWAALNSLMKFLSKRNYIEYNYMEDIERPKNRDLNRINNERILLTQKDFSKILEAAKNGKDFMGGLLKNRDILVILLFLTTGMRRTALSEINISDINMEEKILTVVDKGNKTHFYLLNEQSVFYLNEWLLDREQIKNNVSGDALFLNRDGYRMADHGVWDIVRKYTKEGIGKELSPHKLRSGFCSILYNKTHDLEFVRRVVGHSNIQTTQRYIKTKGTEKEKALQIMDEILN